MARLQMCLEEKLAAGETVSETDVGELLVDFRKEQEGYMEDSFAVIAAYGANAAMMHYHPTPENHAVLQRKGFLLLDTGGQYVDGTTDTTRTYALGELTDEERRYYTYVLKANIGIAGLSLWRAAPAPTWIPCPAPRSGSTVWTTAAAPATAWALWAPSTKAPRAQDDQPCALPAGHDHHR